MFNESAPPASVLQFSGEAARWSHSGLTAAALSVLLQQLPFRTDAVVWARSAHALVLAAVLHRVAQVHVCKHTGNASKRTCEKMKLNLSGSVGLWVKQKNKLNLRWNSVSCTCLIACINVKKVKKKYQTISYIRLCPLLWSLITSYLYQSICEQKGFSLC